MDFSNCGGGQRSWFYDKFSSSSVEIPLVFFSFDFLSKFRLFYCVLCIYLFTTRKSSDKLYSRVDIVLLTFIWLRFGCDFSKNGKWWKKLLSLNQHLDDSNDKLQICQHTNTHIPNISLIKIIKEKYSLI